MSVLIGAARIQDKSGHDYRLQIRGNVPHATAFYIYPTYRFSRLNGWHCGHWHATPEDALACAIAKGAPMQ